MIIGIGTDLVDNRRLEGWLTQPGLLKKYFTDRELFDVGHSAHPAASLAARFAAKEAAAKALGCGIGDVGWKEIEVARDLRRGPQLVLHGAAKALAAELGLTEWSVSLSHTHEHAMAMVVAIG